MRLLVSTCLLLSALGPGRLAWAQSASAAQPLTEQAALQRMMAADPRIQAIRSRPEVVRAAQAERALWPNPVGVFSRESAANGTDLFLVGRQELPISGGLGRLRGASRLAGEAAEAAAAFEIVQLQADLRRSFASLVVAQEREALLAQAERDLVRLVEVLRAREQAGEGSRYDRLRGERGLLDLQDDLAAAGIVRARARTGLASFLGPGVAPEALRAAGSLEPAPVPFLDELVGRALAARGDHRAAELTVERFEEERRAALALRVPTPALSYGLKRSGTGSLANNGHQFSFELGIPVFNRGQAAVALASAESARATAEVVFLRQLVETEVRGAYAVLQMEQERVARFSRPLADDTGTLAAIARIAYDAGELGILDLLDANRQALEARLRALDLAAAHRVAAIELDRVIGEEVRP